MGKDKNDKDEGKHDLTGDRQTGKSGQDIDPSKYPPGKDDDKDGK